MAIVVIGGHSRSVGKTSVVAGIISALPGLNWTAFKITQFGHGRCSLDGKPCDCATDDRCWAMTEETDHSGATDTSRFLCAGARRAFWVRTEQGRLNEAMPAIRRKLDESENAILESNSVLEFVRPDVYITVIDPSIPDFKSSAEKYLSRADAAIVHGDATSAFAETSGTAIPRVFSIRPPRYVTDEIVQFVAERLGTPVAASVPK